ncbi:hypothetical protein KM043_003325 [Ampulex compressa]|nr:hypothetical protein KM043_003325 [Ampulex compressa]
MDFGGPPGPRERRAAEPPESPADAPSRIAPLAIGPRAREPAPNLPAPNLPAPLAAQCPASRFRADFVVFQGARGDAGASLATEGRRGSDGAKAGRPSEVRECKG